MESKKVLSFYIRSFIFMNLGMWGSIILRKNLNGLDFVPYDLTFLLICSFLLPAISTFVWCTDKRNQ